MYRVLQCTLWYFHNAFHTSHMSQFTAEVKCNIFASESHKKGMYSLYNIIKMGFKCKINIFSP